MRIQHHGAINGVTGSCHQLHIDSNNSVLIDCGLFQGTEKGTKKQFKQAKQGENKVSNGRAYFRLCLCRNRFNFYFRPERN